MTTQAFVSGIQNQDLKIPKDRQAHVQRYAMTKQTWSGRSRDDMPFIRHVDIWWLALCIGVQEERRTKLKAEKWHTFIRAGEVLPSNPWRIFQLQLLAVGITKGTEILSKPGEIISMANEYAATGLPIVLHEIQDPHRIPIWIMSDFVSKRLKNAHTY